MSDNQSSPSVLIISEDPDLINELTAKDPSQQFNTSDSIQTASEDSELLANNGIVIVDLAVTGNDINVCVAQLVKLKQQDPTQVLIMVGDAEPLGELLKTNIQPLIYRAFNKPVHVNQVFLAFNSGFAQHADLSAKLAAGEDLTVVGSVDNRTNVNSLSNQNKTNPAIYAAIGLAALGIFGWLLFGGGEADDANQPAVVNQEQNTEAEPIDLELEGEVGPSPQELAQQLNELGDQAFAEGRLMSPKGDNAVEYYDRALELDPYDSRAYKGKKNIADNLRGNYQELVANAEFDGALKVIQTLQQLEPLNLENDALHENLEQAINKHVEKVQKSGSAEEIAKTSEVLSKMESEFAGSQSAVKALQQEKKLLTQIQTALEAGNLIPPQKSNAYALVSEALKKNTISKANLTPEVESLSTKLLELASTKVTEDDLESADKLSALIRRLGVDRAELTKLNKAISGKKEALAKIEAEEKAKAEEAQAAAEEEANKAPTITNAKLVSRAAPRYPDRALSRNIEGWVDLGFDISRKGEPINITVLSSEPEGMFDKAATRAIKKWRFTPAMNEDTGLPVEGRVDSVRVQFKLD